MDGMHDHMGSYFSGPQLRLRFRARVQGTNSLCSLSVW